MPNTFPVWFYPSSDPAPSLNIKGSCSTSLNIHRFSIQEGFLSLTGYFIKMQFFSLLLFLNHCSFKLGSQLHPFLVEMTNFLVVSPWILFSAFSGNLSLL